MIEQREPLLSVTEVAQRLGVSPKSVRAWCREGQLPAVFVGGAWRVHPSDLASWLEDGTRRRLRYAEPEYAVPVRP